MFHTIQPPPASSATETRAFSLLPLIEIADVVIAMVSSGSKTAVLQNPEVPLILLRPQTSWEGANASEVASWNEGLVLGSDTATVLNEHLSAHELVKAVDAVVGRADCSPVEHLRTVRRRWHRNYWFGSIDGFEEIRTWFALLLVSRHAPLLGLWQLTHVCPLHSLCTFSNKQEQQERSPSMRKRHASCSACIAARWSRQPDRSTTSAVWMAHWRTQRTTH